MTNHGTQNGTWHKPLDKAREPIRFEGLTYVLERAQALTHLLLGISLTPAFKDSSAVAELIESELAALTALTELADPEPGYNMAGRYLGEDGAKLVAGAIALAEQQLLRFEALRIEGDRRRAESATDPTPLAEALAPYGRPAEPVRPVGPDEDCTECGRDNRNGTHDALERSGHLAHTYTTEPQPMSEGAPSSSGG